MALRHYRYSYSKGIFKSVKESTEKIKINPVKIREKISYLQIKGLKAHHYHKAFIFNEMYVFRWYIQR